MNAMSQGMFGGFGGQSGLNGMNMGMNFNNGQGMFGQNFNNQNNMWNNQNAFPNGMGDFSSNSGYGSNMFQQGNHQQYNNNDYQNQNSNYNNRGFGRGRGRGRGGRGGFERARGSFHQQVPAVMTPQEQQQFEIQKLQSQMSYPDRRGSAPQTPTVDSSRQSLDGNQNGVKNEFAPGGQDEVREALGEERKDSRNGNRETEPVEENVKTEEPAEVLPVRKREDSVPREEPEQASNTGSATQDEPIVAQSPIPDIDEKSVADGSMSVDMQDSPQQSMPPPSAPLGPAAQYNEREPVRDFGFRGRGHGRFASRGGRGSFSASTSTSFSPVKSVVEPPPKSVPETKGNGVRGAPTGPRAMRAPILSSVVSTPTTPTAPPSGPARSREREREREIERESSGFQIMGRASLASQASKAAASERSRRYVGFKN